MSQEIKYLNIRDLVLWTENPRDPINVNASDQDVADRAINTDGRDSWSLVKLYKRMGKRFDHSEIPTVAYVEGRPVVYDGNRRVLIGKIIHNCVKVQDGEVDFSGFDFPEEIPCNVCDQQTALEHVDRKHGEGGSWKPLERDIFKHKHMREAKSPFLVIEDATDIISNNPELNQRFVKDEIFDATTLHKIGFSTTGGELKTKYQNSQDAMNLLNHIAYLARAKEITTRKNRGNVVKLLPEEMLNKQSNDFFDFSSVTSQSSQSPAHKTRITKGKEHMLFGEKLFLRPGAVNNLYSDLLRLYKDKQKYSEDFPMLIRMALRLLVEIAADDIGESRDELIENNYKNARQLLSKDEKTTLSSQSVSDESKLIHLLQAGAHGYTASNNLEQAVAMSLIIGKILVLTHGK